MSPPSLDHQPALDGLRGLAVIAVVIYHLDANVLPGGFLGVSLFFTLSGFLITNVVLAGADRTGGIGLGNFWLRRVQRLLPAAMITVALVVALTYYFGSANQLTELRGDVGASLAYVQNWRQLANGTVYGSHYLEPSMLQHFWSLAIEEQFYVVFPLLAWLLLRLRAGRGAWLAVVGGLAAVSIAVQLAIFDSSAAATVNRAYLGSDTRAVEILVGIGLAVLIRMVPPRRVAELARGYWTAPLLAVPLVAAAFIWRLTEQTDAWLYRGGLVAVALLSAVLIVVALTPGPVRGVLSWRPLCWVGTISYGVYLYHWPIFQVMTRQRIGFGGWPLALVRVAVSLAAAVVSFYAIEQPIRRGRVRLGRSEVRIRGRPLAAMAPAVVIALLWGAGVAHARAAERAVDVKTAAAIRARPAAATTTTSTTTTTVPLAEPAAAIAPPTPPATASTTAPTTTIARRPVRKVLFLGDSLVHQSLPGLVAVFAEQGIEVRAVGGPGQTMLSHRAEWEAQLSEAVAGFDPDVVVLEGCCGYESTAGAYSAADGRTLAADSRDLYVEWARAALEVTDLAGRGGAMTMWVLGPPAGSPNWFGPIYDRIPIINDIYRGLAACDPAIGLLDWGVVGAPDGSYTESLPGADGQPVQVRTEDKLHFTPAGVGVIALASLEAIDAAWQASRGRGRGPTPPPPPTCDPSALVPAVLPPIGP